MTETREKNLQEIGKNAMASIREMVAALECDYDRLEELREARDDADHPTTWEEENPDDAIELVGLLKDAGECKDQDEARERIQEDPLSIEYRSGWVTDKSEMQAEEACILLTTGGPAVRIMVELDDGEPTRAYLQVQDWGTPWTDYYEEGIGEILMAYVGCFYFGD